MTTTQALKITGRILKGITLGLLALMAGVLALLGAASRAEHERERDSRLFGPEPGEGDYHIDMAHDDPYNQWVHLHPKD